MSTCEEPDLRDKANQTRKFWSKSVPMVFQDQPRTYAEKRDFRYGLQDYMHAIFRFEDFEGRNVLEIGVGSGIDSAEFLRNGANVIGVDFSPLAIRSAKELFREAELEGQLALTDAAHIPFKDEEFDAVYCFGVIHHIPDVRSVLLEVKRVLKSNGIFMGMVYNKDSLLYAYSILYLHGIKEGLLAKGVSELELASDFSERQRGNVYTKVYTADELRSFLSQFFDPVFVQTHYNVIDMPKRRKLKFSLEDRADLGWHLVFKGTKK